MSKKIFIAVLFASTMFFAVGGMMVHAQTDTVTNPPPTDTVKNAPGSSFDITITNPLTLGEGNDTIEGFLKNVLNKIILPIGGLIAVLAFVWVGFQFVTAGGDQAKIKNARGALVNVAVGTALLLGATVILDVLANTINQLRS